jgi:hypothetical protein
MDFSTHASTSQALERCATGGQLRRGWRHLQACLLLLCLFLGLPGVVRADPPEVAQMALQRSTEGLFLTARLQLQPTRVVEDTLLKGVPLYFVWRADVVRGRWYWTDKRVASAVRTWRLVYQPLTGRWRLSMATDAASSAGGAGLQYALHQNFDSLAQALASVSRVLRWKLSDAARLDPDSEERVEWSFQLDLGLLPRPFQIGVANQSDWLIDVHRVLSVPRHVEPAPAESDGAAR